MTLSHFHYSLIIGNGFRVIIGNSFRVINGSGFISRCFFFMRNIVL